MGCDIHTVVEQRVNGKWVTIDTCNGHHRQLVRDGEYDYSAPVASTRNYVRFSALAGVRGDGPEPRGLPDDLSETAAFLADKWGVDGHSHSWLPLREAAQVYLTTDSPEIDPESFKAKFPISYYFNAETDDVSEDDLRLIFWFDN